MERFLDYLVRNFQANIFWIYQEEALRKLLWIERINAPMADFLLKEWVWYQQPRSCCAVCQWEEVNTDCPVCLEPFEDHDYDEPWGPEDEGLCPCGGTGCDGTCDTNTTEMYPYEDIEWTEEERQVLHQIASNSQPSLLGNPNFPWQQTEEEQIPF